MTTALLALGIVSSSFFGSWHCAAMCGPVASLMATRKQLWIYHLGRLISYSALGFLAGYFGQFFLNSEFVLLRWISALLMGLILIYSGLKFITPSFFNSLSSHAKWAQLIVNLVRRIQAFQVSRSGFWVGILTAFLPCGWLYTYVTAAIATQSPYAGALVMACFWLGGIPALAAVPAMVRGTIAKAGLRKQKIAGGILVLAGVYTISSFMYLH